MSAPPPFSVLMSVYDGDDGEHLEQAFASITTGQQLPPAQVVLVRDGPVRAELQRRIDALVATSPVPVTYVPLATNQRLARALSAGLDRCEHDIVARADADDVCLPERFARQIPLVAGGVDLLGSAVEEFSEA